MIAAFNEQACIERKLENLAQTDYPKDRLQIIIVSDGSTDRTNDLLRAITLQGLELILLPERKGKPNALNVGVER